MATKKQETNEGGNRLHDLVEFYAFKDSDKYKDDICVGVNGKIYQIKRGETVYLPRNVYLILKRSLDQDKRTADLISLESGKFELETRQRGY